MSGVFKDKRKVRSLGKHILLLFMLINSAGCSLACGILNPPVHYILPNGYRGVFKIILDEANGTDVKREERSYTYEIPPNGILRIKSFAPLSQMHEASAAYKNGTKIPTLSTVNDDTIALRDVGMHERGDGPRTITIVIGTKEQADKVRRDKLEDEEFDNTPPQIYNQQLIQQ